jgi:uncharacterized heparinase superfamily protein
LARATSAHSTVTFNDASSARFVTAPAFRRVLGGAPMLGGPSRVTVTRDDQPDALALRATHDGYVERFGILHERTLVLAADGSRIEGEDFFLAADGQSEVRTTRDRYAVRFHLHPSVKATRLSDGHGAMLMAPDKELWTLTVHDGRIELEDSVYLAGAEGPRRTTQLVIYGHARHAPRVSWSLHAGPAALLKTTARSAREDEPRL